MRRVALWLCLVLCIGVVTGAFAKDRKDHKNDYERVLFGKQLTKEERERFPQWGIIEEALYVAIDYYNGAKSGDTALTHLMNNRIKGLPKQTKVFNFDDNSRHERLTHLGWDHLYDGDLAKWKEIRKPLLIASVDHALGYNKKLLKRISFFGLTLRDESTYSKQCVSFSAFLYYVHVIGDHINNEAATYDTRMPLGLSQYRASNPDVMYELMKHLTILFENQRFNTRYIRLMQKLGDKAKEIRSLNMSTKEALIENYDLHRNYAKEVIEILAEDVPKLLKNEPFFKKVFYK